MQQTNKKQTSVTTTTP